LLVLPAFSVMELDSDKIVGIILSRHSNEAPISKVLLNALNGEKTIVVTRDGACGTINRRVLHIVKVLIIIIVWVIVLHSVEVRRDLVDTGLFSRSFGNIAVDSFISAEVAHFFSEFRGDVSTFPALTSSCVFHGHVCGILTPGNLIDETCLVIMNKVEGCTSCHWGSNPLCGFDFVFRNIDVGCINNFQNCEAKKQN